MSVNENDFLEIPLLDALQIAQSIKATHVRPKSLQEYKNLIERFQEYLERKNMLEIKTSQFSKTHAIRYLDDVLVTRGVSALTRNNYIRVLRSLFYVLVEREYIKINPFVGIKRLKETQKKRKTFTVPEKRCIINFIKDDDKELLLAICLCYYCAIRPAELRRLRIKNIDLKIGLVHMDGTQTKNHENASITIPQILIPLIESYQLHRYPSNYYIFGENTLKPGAKPCGRDTISKRHKKAITDLEKYKFLDDIEGKTFYSWKDTSARDLIEEGLNIMELKDHFRHKEIQTTQRYLQMYSGINQKIRDVKNQIF